MSQPFDITSLPPDIARRAQAQVAKGRFESIEEVLLAALDAIEERDEVEQEWLNDARTRWRAGVTDSARGLGVEGTAAQHMARIRARIEQE